MEPHETEATGASSGPQTLLCSYSLGGHVEACLLPPCPELQIQCGEVEPRKMPCNRFPMLLDCDPTQSPCSWQRPSTRGCFLPKNLAQKRGFETRRQALAFGSWGPGEAGPAAMHPSQSWPSSGMLNIMRNSRLLSTASPTGWWQNDSGSRGFCGAPGQSHTKFHGLGSRYRKGRGGRVPEPCVLSEKCMPSQAPGPLHPRRQAVLFLARREGQQRLES
ncbi:zinc finger and SCAN domain-containing protein 32 isoform X9 [Canis lupus familiaris]|uniref:zinc finger and SCAN domain-containing protein 32 isoform X9 n=1 Tax=Canis lupus familiaris TaxID=9615 RepID=UPI0018F7D2F8|nr:zinc finger and SCAN domain-containing protein 32 isoform X9 [Canis lupus familiaris]